MTDIALGERPLGWKDLLDEVATIMFLARVALYKRYCGSWLGASWSLLNPVAQIAILYFAFSIVMKVPIENYVIYLTAGLLPWNFLSTSLTTAATSLSGRKTVLNCSTIPYRVFILADVTTEFLNFAIAYTLLIVVSTVALNHYGPWMAYLFIMLPAFLIFVYGLAVFIAHLSVWFRDLQHLLQIALSIMFWLTPIVYHWSMVPKQVAALVKYNPLSLVISPLQVILHGESLPSFHLILSAYALAILSIVSAYVVSRKFRNDVIYFV